MASIPDESPGNSSGIVDHLRSYRERASPAESTYRRFVRLRSFLRWVSSRHGLPDPFRDLEDPPIPRPESDWLTQTSPDDSSMPLAARSEPPRLAERDQLVLLTLVLTGPPLRRLRALEIRQFLRPPSRHAPPPGSLPAPLERP